MATAYGYGQVYREYPQVALQQPKPQFAVKVGAPAQSFLTPNSAYGESENWPAIGRLDQVLYMVSLGLPAGGTQAVQSPQRVVPAWVAEVANWAAIGRLDEVVYLTRAAIPPQTGPQISTPAWAAELANWAAIGRLDEVVYMTRPQLGPSPAQIIQYFTPQQVQLLNWAAIGRLDEVVYLVKTSQPPTVPVPIIPSWLWEVQNWAAIGRMDEVVYLVAPSLPFGGNQTPFVPPNLLAAYVKSRLIGTLFVVLGFISQPLLIAPWEFEKTMLAAWLRRPDDYLQPFFFLPITQKKKILVCEVDPSFMPEVPVAIVTSPETAVSVGFSATTGTTVSFTDVCGSPR